MKKRQTKFPQKKAKKSVTKKQKAKKTSSKKLSSKKTTQSRKKTTNKSLEFHIENIRCFDSRQTLNIRPLTFLIGENSTGKTTLLSCFNVLNKIIRPRTPWDIGDFNEKPYNMGSFQDIIRKSNKNNHNNKNTFNIGFTIKHLNTTPKIECNICFKQKKEGAEPAIDYINIKYGDYTLSLHYTQNSFSLENKTKKYSFKESLPSNLRELSLPLHFLFHIIDRHSLFINKKNQKPNQKDIKQIIKETKQIIKETYSFFSHTLNLAPIRSKPKHTYDSIRESIDPEGKEIPMTLMLIESNKKEKWKELHNKLLHFGQKSGLFSSIKVKKYEKKSISGPFQLQFEVRGALSSIADTGYGISQILPMLVHIFRAPKQFRFLIQQPEVHLHPKAQAELSSLLIQSIKDKTHSFLVETHSDYMVDRVRIEIRKGLIPHDQVSLIYLEPPVKGGEVKVHNIFFDKQANIINPPKGYRDFFLKETDRLLGFKD